MPATPGKQPVQGDWSCVDYSSESLESVEQAICLRGYDVRKLPIGSYLPGFRAWLTLAEYASDYKVYGGVDEHCFLEKAIEHYLSVCLLEPAAQKTYIDIGSCRSVFPSIVSRLFQCRCYLQDLEYPTGVSGNYIGSSADAIPLPDQSVDGIVVHCAFEHFEGSCDTGFIRECSRLLVPGASVVIAPLYLNSAFVNVTGEKDPGTQRSIFFDENADGHFLIPEWKNRFGRHYSPEALMLRVLEPATAAGMQITLFRVERWQDVHEQLWLRWILKLTV